MEQKLIKFNCGGREFIIHQQTLILHKNEFLYKMLLNQDMKPGSTTKALTGEDIYFIDRNPKIMSAILDYYRDDRLIKPKGIDNIVWKQNLDYFGIDSTLAKNTQQIEKIEAFDPDNGIKKINKDIDKLIEDDNKGILNGDMYYFHDRRGDLSEKLTKQIDFTPKLKNSGICETINTIISSLNKVIETLKKNELL